MNLNKVIIVGRVTKDIEMRTTSSGINVSSFGVATNKIYKDAAGNKQENVEFHNVVLWRRLAEIASQYLAKGQLVLIEGHLQTRNWEGKDGVTRYQTEVVGDNMQLGPKAGGTQGGSPSSSDNTPPPIDDGPASPPPAQNNKNNDSKNEEDIKVEDIPF